MSKYLDGVDVTLSSCSDCFGYAATTELAIGNRAGATNQPFDGLIDEVEIFNSALSDSEIQAIFDAGSAGKIKPGADTTPEEAIAELQTDIANLESEIAGSWDSMESEQR